MIAREREVKKERETLRERERERERESEDDGKTEYGVFPLSHSPPSPPFIPRGEHLYKKWHFKIALCPESFCELFGTPIAYTNVCAYMCVCVEGEREWRV